MRAGAHGSRRTYGSESEGTVMAKRGAKRETNAQRSERDNERRTTLEMAKFIAGLIRERRERKAEDWPARRKTYTSVGQAFCEFHENPPVFLRLVADILEGKLRYSPGRDWNDGAIEAAFTEAIRRMPWPRWLTRYGFPVIVERPSFSEFLAVFSEQNPKSKLPEPPSARSLRRSLKRLGYHTRPDVRGRPKKK